MSVPLPDPVPPGDALSQHRGLTVVGVGASAGGLQAATRFFAACRTGGPMAFILVQHQDPGGDSLMPDLLAPHTGLAVREATEAAPVLPGHLYVLPPGAYLSVEDGLLHLSAPAARPGTRLPFDFLLHALARQYGDRAACVVLSGTGADGSAGLRSINAAGGLVVVQDPAEASYDGMPRSAIDTGLVDLVQPVDAIPAALAAHRTRSPAPAPRQPPARTLPDILELLRIETGHDFALYKHGTLDRRVKRRMALHQLRPAEMGAYHLLLKADPTELDALASDLLIHVTSFFRDPAVFATLAQTTIPALIESQRTGPTPDQPLRLWVAGCSTGEEAYSLAILCLEQAAAAASPVRLQVFASDIDAEAIAAARDGAYPATIEASVSPARLARFFVREEAGWRAAPELRSAIVFTVQDVLADPPFSRLDMVSCRNLLIYLRPKAQARVIETFHFALRDGGILLLGSAENPPGAEGRFEAVAKAEHIFRRVGRAARALLPVPLAQGTGTTQPLPPPRPAPLRQALTRPGEERRPPPPGQPFPPRPPRTDLAELGRRLVMEAYAPASILIDATNAVLFSLGPTDRYLRLPPGHATHDLLAMARPGLRGKLRQAVQAARDTGAAAHDSGLVIGEDGSRPFSLTVHPVAEEAEPMLMVCLLDAARPERGPGELLAPGQANRVAELERELESTRAELQGTVRDLEISSEEQRAINEEALSVNEEYQSTNEEMVASKEELQSLNEELTAVNSQLQETLQRQRTTSDDLQNVLYSTKVATLFLDLEGRIRFFTPGIQALFAVIPGDVGRKLADFATLAPDGALDADVQAVQARQQPVEREIQTADGTWFRRHILPYRAGGGGMEGVVITFNDITANKAAARALEAAKQAADAANAAKSRFLAAASHDLRQPLQTIALLQALLTETVSGDRARELLARQHTTLGTVTDMLDTLLDINEIEAGGVQPVLSAVAIGDVLERLRGEFAYHAQARSIELRVVPCRHQVRTDPKLLEQMIRNLLSNAFKYTERGRILIGCRNQGGTLSVQVWDTGIGIRPADLGAIFEEYFQVENAARQRSRGLGLGLSIVRRLGDLLRHPVGVTSRIGHGSCFTIAVPRCTRAVPAMASARPGPAAPTRALRILVVEDDPDVAEMLGALLGREGHQVTVAQDGPGALQPLAAQRADPDGDRPDVVLADYNLPNGLNGLQLAAAMRAIAGPALPVVILTGDTASTTLRAVTQAGCLVLSKPVGFADLREAIARALAPPGAGSMILAPPGAGSMILAPPGAGPMILPPPGAGPSILVVDDDDEVRAAIMEAVQGDGRTALGFPSGEAFLQGFRPGPGQCVLIDAGLPGMSGIDLLDALRHAGHDLPAIVVTGQSDVPMAVRAMKAGASDFIEKPIGRTELLASIARAMERALDGAKTAAWHQSAAAQVETLTPRQREIMAMVVAGHPSKNIAADLGISQRTVESHRAAIMRRTGVASLPALARLALAAGLAGPAAA